MTDLAECTACPSLGACCFFSAPVRWGQERVLVRSRVACPHLGRDGLCTRYETRREVPWCGQVQDPRVVWPTFCPNFRARGERIVEREALLDFAAETPAEAAALLQAVDSLVIETLRKTWGVAASAGDPRTNLRPAPPPALRPAWRV
jgi:hypothetical protein